MTLQEAVRAATGGRPFVFVIMGYHDRRETFLRIKQTVEGKLHLACIRADEVDAAGYDILGKVRHLIDRSAAVVAEISTKSENVFYEAGYATGVGKPPLLLIQQGRKKPTDFRGLELIVYQDTASGWEHLLVDVERHLAARVGSQNALLHDMLAGTEPHPAYIAASPLDPPGRALAKAQLYARGTFSDYLAILSLSSAFGSMWGPGTGVELVAAKPEVAELRRHARNLYLIGSDRSNPHTGVALAAIQRAARVRWSFEPKGRVQPGGHAPTVLRRTEGNRAEELDSETIRVGGDPFWARDHGIIVRAPHPLHPDRIVIVLAGAHAVGTAAAAIAATSPRFIRDIAEGLPDGTLRDKRSAFWALVEGKCDDRALTSPDPSEGSRLVDDEGVRVLEAGVYEQVAGPVPESWEKRSSDDLDGR